jgi:hypothetical protein
MSNKLLIGWSEKCITPAKKVKLAGQFYERISEYTETPITVTSMAIESNGDQLIICSCDLVGISDELVNSVRIAVVEKNKEIDANKIIIAATHTHTSIHYNVESNSSGSSLGILERYLPESKNYIKKVSDDNVMQPIEAFGFLTERISACIVEAWVNRIPSHYANEFGRAVVGHCRRVVYDDNSARMWGDTSLANFESLESGNDSGIELIYIFDASKNLTGIVINIACPSQVLEHRSFISSDYWGKVKILLREKYGEELKVLCLCSAAGDQCPRDLIRWKNSEIPIDDPNIERKNNFKRKTDPSMFDIEGTWEIGKRIVNEIIDIYPRAAKQMEDKAHLNHKVEFLDLPIRRVSIYDYNDSKKALEEYIKAKQGDYDFKDNARLHIYAGTVARYEFQQTCDIKRIEVHFVRFGNIAFATNPFELFLNYGNQIKARSKAEQTFVIQLSNGSFGYLPTKQAEQGSHYSAYVSSGIIGHQGGELLVRKTIQEINKMFSDF